MGERGAIFGPALTIIGASFCDLFVLWRLNFLWLSVWCLHDHVPYLMIYGSHIRFVNQRCIPPLKIELDSDKVTIVNREL